MTEDAGIAAGGEIFIGSSSTRALSASTVTRGGIRQR